MIFSDQFVAIHKHAQCLCYQVWQDIVIPISHGRQTRRIY